MSPVKTYTFGPFLLVPERQLLLRDLQPVAVGDRAFGLLMALVERAGQVVTKRELMARVWPDTVVVEGNIKVNIWALRQALRQALQDPQAPSAYIATVPGRGYRFTAAVQVSVLPTASHASPLFPVPPSSFAFAWASLPHRVNPGAD